MLGEIPGKKLNGYTADYVVFDLETTGTSPTWDDVIEISAVKAIGGRVVDEFSTLVNPQRPISPDASAVNGIYDDMVKDSPVMEKVFAEFNDFIGNSVLVGHNIALFDMKYLYKYAANFYGKTLTNDYIDTLPMARQLLPDLEHHRLVNLAEYYGISPEGAHRALNDARMNYEVYERLGAELAYAEKHGPRCPVCGKLLMKKKGKYGMFLGCTGYPECRYTKNI